MLFPRFTPNSEFFRSLFSPDPQMGTPVSRLAVLAASKPPDAMSAPKAQNHGCFRPERVLPAQQMLVQTLLSDGPAGPDLLQLRANLQPDKQDEFWKTPHAPTTFNPRLVLRF